MVTKQLRIVKVKQFDSKPFTLCPSNSVFWSTLVNSMSSYRKSELKEIWNMDVDT